MALDTRNADTAAWLVKVPYALASVWKAACDQSMAGHVDDTTEGQLLGRIVTEEDVSFLELPESMIAEGIPRRFKLQNIPLPAAEASRMNVVSYDAPAPGAGAGAGPGAAPAAPASKELPKPRVDGTVQARLDMVPMTKDDKGEWVLDQEYLKLVRSRTEQAAEKVRVVGSYEDMSVDNRLADLAQHRRIVKDMNTRRKAAEAEKKADSLKRPRLEKEELEELLFRLFERNSAWAFKSLIAETKQPQLHLKAVLEGIATQQKRGPNKDKYELKPEYRSSKGAGAAKPAG
ncbi:hypothetical protein HYH03_002385 [Edaphochlamys debaryana]|uniref:TFIIF beta subunit HTH domain-containing protein n=1 Tax=Edaphochlamys debaryana TaxID=47281 RepID=A0A836C4Z3_9CHLO|nr:hypothetical protein HYH03_002385 [Edaphochlamys debaryana]|eukprot:KAG2499438.1 hypothetical protein HYH03_002385 [Edaphochlamys debaryana]